MRSLSILHNVDMHYMVYIFEYICYLDIDLTSCDTFL